MTETTEFTERQQAVIDKYREDLLSGRTLALHAQSHRSRFGYQPPMGRRSWAHAMGTLAAMAKESGKLAQVASEIIGRVNLYGTDGQACAAIYEAAFTAMNKPYDDVIGRTGPEAGRYSSYQHAWTLYDRVAVHYWLELACRGMTATAPGVGWCLTAIAKEVGFRPTREMETKKSQ